MTNETKAELRQKWEARIVVYGKIKIEHFGS